VEIFVGHCLTIILGILNAQSFGLLIGVTTKNFDQAQTSATVIVLSFMLCAGFFIQEVPGFLSWVKCAAFPDAIRMLLSSHDLQCIVTCW
jgi:hypothetical protein